MGQIIRNFSLFGRLAGTAFASVLIVGGAQGASVTIDNTTIATYPTLSSAVNFVQATDDGPHTINIMVDSLPTSDTQIVITEPITIEGDADNNGTQCDILVDTASIDIEANLDEGQPGKAYLEVQCPGAVNIRNLKIHPNSDGRNNAARRVDGVRTLRPTSGAGDYTFYKVYVSGSDDSNNYIDLGTGSDIYTGAAKGWSGTAATGSVSDADNAVFQVVASANAGTYDLTLDHCHAGLSRTTAVNLAETGGSSRYWAGFNGHSLRDAIKISGGSNITIQGTTNDRVRILRCPNVTGKDAHGLEIGGSAQLNLVEYVDMACSLSGNAFKLNDGTITTLRHCRMMEKNPGGTISNQVAFLQGTATVTNPIEACTFFGSGNSPTPLFVSGNITGTFSFQDCIFVSNVANSTLNINNTAGTDGVQAIINCALPTDGFTGESLSSTPIGGTTVNPVTPQNTVIESPKFTKLIADYDWSDFQNGDGNADVYRPSNKLAYTAVASGGGNLVGGAGGTLVPVTLSGFEIE